MQRLGRNLLQYNILHTVFSSICIGFLLYDNVLYYYNNVKKSVLYYYKTVKSFTKSRLTTVKIAFTAVSPSTLSCSFASTRWYNNSFLNMSRQKVLCTRHEGLTVTGKKNYATHANNRPTVFSMLYANSNFLACSYYIRRTLQVIQVPSVTLSSVFETVFVQQIYLLSQHVFMLCTLYSRRKYTEALHIAPLWNEVIE